MEAHGVNGQDRKSARRGGGGLVAVIVIVVILAAAAVLAYMYLGDSQARVTPIGAILKDLRTYDGKQVTVKGTVVARMSILALKWYTLQDKTGDIMVITSKGLPNRDEEITVNGTVHEVFNVGGYDKTVIVEGGEPGAKEDAK